MNKDVFRKWLENVKNMTTKTTSSYISFINKISLHYNKQNNENIDLFDISDILRIINIANNFGNDESYKKLDDKAHGGPRAAISKYIEFLEYKVNEKEKIENNGSKELELNDNGENTAYTKKPKPAILIKKPLYEDKVQRVKQPYDIAQRIREILLKINEICRLHNKKHIFDQAALFELWGDIENSCKSKNDFKNFTGNLYKLLREKTRYDNPNKKTKDDPKYIFLLPNNFIKIGTPTRHFWDNVNTLRHYYIHDEMGKIADVYGEFLGNNKKSGPETPEDYMKLQIEVLKQFEDSMEKLLEMVKVDLNRSKTH
jgi:hypothetical protein